ncbi:MAG: hypothetical protein JXA28_03395, partial [Bacteroidetes bacterium]|nr:hypothetical protein [Bacteroidota bacterium]
MKSLLMSLLSLLLFLLPMRGMAQDASQAGKPHITTEADIPRFTYDVSGSASEVFQNPEAMDDLMKRLRLDIKGLLEDYVIDDRATRKSIHGTLAMIALLEEDYSAAGRHIDLARELEEKQASRAAANLLLRSLLAARQAMDNGQELQWQEALSHALQDRLGSMPWDIVQDEIESIKGQLELMSENLALGIIQSTMDPAVSEKGSLSADLAKQLASMKVYVTMILPDRDTYHSVLTS